MIKHVNSNFFEVVFMPLSKKTSENGTYFEARNSKNGRKATLGPNVWKPTEIIHLTGYPKSTVYDLVSQLKKRSDVMSLYKSGRPPILTSKNQLHLGLLVQNNKMITAAEMTKKLIQKNPDLKVSVRTVQRMLKKTFS